MTAVAAVEFVQLQAANDRIEELEAELGGGGQTGGDGLFEQIGDALKDLVGDLGKEFAGLEGLPAADLIQCLGDGLSQGSRPAEGDDPVAAVAATVEDVRELEFQSPVQPTFLPPEKTAARIRQAFLSEYTEGLADREERVLGAVAAVPAGTDLRQVRAEALGREVVGFYDPETGELVVQTGGPELRPFERVTLAHELDHALTDQRLGIPLPDDLVAGAEDADLAGLSLVEGDATLTMQRYSTTLSVEDQVDLIDPQAVAEAQAGLATLPHFLQRELLFPYEEGLDFVCRLYAAGGWDAVNAAYESPPQSSDEILFPDRYIDDVGPVDPPDPSSPGTAWTPGTAYQLGAAHLLWLFEAPGGDPGRALSDPRDRVAAWAGGEVHLWTRGPDSAVGIVLAERAGTDLLCESVRSWYGSSFDDDGEVGSAGTTTFDGPRQDAALTCGPDDVRLGVAPDLRTAKRLTQTA